MARISEYWKCGLTILLGVAVCLFWCYAYPQVLSYHEQNQMFLWTADYFVHDISVAGGLADYLSEFIVQFFYIGWAGSLFLGFLFAIFQRLTYLVIRSYFSSPLHWLWYILSILPSLLLLLLMGDINVLWSFPVSLTIALMAVWLMNKSCRRQRKCALADIAVIPLLFWLAGGVAVWAYVILRCIFYLYAKRRCWIYYLSIPYLAAVQLVCANTILSQWPTKSVFIGINYYFIPMQYPGEHFGYDKEMYELLMLDYLIRNERWNEVIERASEYQVKTGFSSNCVNLALAQTRQLADRMFDFYQSGGDALLMPMKRDNMSNYPTMEAFWRLGLINSCLRYASDLQESILNARKSGRLTKRITECQIANGNYKIAQKNIDLLKNTLFYSSWANKAEAMLGNDTMIEHDPDLGRARRMRFRKDFLFSHAEVDKIMGLLFINNTDNKMALDYFMGEMLLNGNTQGFIQYMSWVQQYGGYRSMPAGYQDAVRCIQSQGNAPGSRYAEYAKRMMSRKGGGQ